MLSIITPTYNCEQQIMRLIKSLEIQNVSEFEWIVVDSMSKDNTLELVNSSKIKSKKIICEKDFGIYDAINKGIRLANFDYYIVAGSDDYFYEHTIKSYIDTLQNSQLPIDFIFSKLTLDSFLCNK